jgi:transcriptional regulator with XRE-family HTH domain
MDRDQDDHYADEEGGEVDRIDPVSSTRPLHRLGEVRIREEISRRSVARFLGVGVREVKFQEQKTTDLPLSILYKWQEALKVPLVELLAEPSDALSSPLVNRARLVKLMKTAQAIVEEAKQPSVLRLARRVIGQLVAIMPELREVNSWPLGGQRRRRSEYGRAAECSLSEKTLSDLGDGEPPPDRD